MKKIYQKMAFLLACSLLFMSCGKNEQKQQDITQTGESVSVVETESQIQNEQESLAEEKMISVFYPASDNKSMLEDVVKCELDGTEDAITVSMLLEILGTKGVVPDGVQVLSENIREDEEQSVLFLSVSSEYREFISSVGSMDAEILYIAALTNTLIENLSIDAVRLSIEGGNLVTENRVYNNPLTFYDPEHVDSVWEGYQYELVEQNVMNEACTFAALYPEFTNMENVALMETFNNQIKHFIEGKMDAHQDGTEIIHYEITYQDGDYVSILFRGECNSTDVENYVRYAATFNFDLSKETNRRLKDYVDIGHVIDCLELSTNYELIGESRLSTEEFKNYLATGGSEDFMFLLLDYDFDPANADFVPTGYTYTDASERTVLVMSVSREMGNYVEIEIQ